MNTLVIDAYDSFVYIIYQYLLTLGLNATVVRNDKINLSAIPQYQPDFIVLGPGPGHPADAHYIEIIHHYGHTIPILGICLGHQAIALAYGGQVDQAKHIMHGKTSLIEHDGKGCFNNQPNPFTATRYHSLIANEQHLPSCLIKSAYAQDDSYIMGLRHVDLAIESVQFHPESICTESGINLFKNFIDYHVKSN